MQKTGLEKRFKIKKQITTAKEMRVSNTKQYLASLKNGSYAME